MKILSQTENSDLATVYLGETGSGKTFEFVESVQPPYPREKKWVIIVSTLFGCPVGCPICDAGNFYNGKLSEDEILAQIDFLVTRRFANRIISSEKFKIQFARMGDPAFNMSVIGVLEKLPRLYNAPGLLPSISTVAPHGCDVFFKRLIELKRELYQGRFQLQFSIHTTDTKLRDRLIPVKKWGFDKIAEYGERFFDKGDRKITLNFALEKNSPLDPEILLKHFDPKLFLIKITPVNPTYRASQNGLVSYIDPDSDNDNCDIENRLLSSGYDVIISIGETIENFIGSNCGQFVTRHLKADRKLEDGYTFKVNEFVG